MHRSSIILCLILGVSLFLCGQTQFVSIGTQRSGLCLGNSPVYHGIRFNLVDKDVHRIHGLNISCISEAIILNGIALGLAGGGNPDSLCSASNGMFVGGLFGRYSKLNGVGVAGLSLIGDTLNGLFLAPFGVSGSSDKKNAIRGVAMGVVGSASASDFKGVALLGVCDADSFEGVYVGGGIHSIRLRGFSLGGIASIADRMDGMFISGINLTHELHGVQLGWINYAGNNQRFLRWIPLMNMHIKKR